VHPSPFLTNPKLSPMKKICILFICSLFLSNSNSQTPIPVPYISDLFAQVTSQEIQTGFDSNGIDYIHTTCDSSVFIIHKKGFQNQLSTKCANILKINAFTGMVEPYSVAASPSFLENGGKLNRTWIWSLAATDRLLFLAVDDEIWIYQLSDTKQYEYLSAMTVKEVSKLMIAGNDLHIFASNEKGFDWMKINLTNFEIKNVRQLVLKNQFFLQIGPVQVIAMNNNALYLMQQNERSIEKYALNGDLLNTYALQIPNWNKIPDEITFKLDSIKNITERNYAFSKFEILNYNMMHLFYVFPNERFLMIAIDKNLEAGTFFTPYFIQIIGDKVIVEPYSTNLHDSEVFGVQYFPFLPARAEGNIVFAQLNEYIAQINQSTTVSWEGKTHKEFQNDVNLYHRDNEPVEKLETYRFVKNYIPADSVQFLDYDDRIFSLNHVKKDKAIFIISQHPQCSTCIKILWRFFTNQKFSRIELYIVEENCPTYLLKKEKIKELNIYVKTEYTPLFINPRATNPETKIVLNQSANPLVLLFDKKLQHFEVITVDNIIGDITGNLKTSFIQTIRNFVEN
jgi:hypothetical protein